MKVIEFAEIERRFELAPLDMGFGPVHPAVVGPKQGQRDGYSIRVRMATRWRGGRRNDTFDYFRADADGVVNEAPRGYTSEYRGARITGLDNAVALYAAKVR